MKRIILALALLCAVPATAQYSGVLTTNGNPATTVESACGDTWQTLAAVYGTAIGAPVSVLITIDAGGNAAYVGFGSGGAPSDGGHEIAAGGSAFFQGGNVGQRMYLKNFTGGSNATVKITLFY